MSTQKIILSIDVVMLVGSCNLFSAEDVFQIIFSSASSLTHFCVALKESLLGHAIAIAIGVIPCS